MYNEHFVTELPIKTVKEYFDQLRVKSSLTNEERNDFGICKERLTMFACDTLSNDTPYKNKFNDCIDIVSKQRYTLTIVFDKAKTHVLMLFHNKQHRLNFIGGKIEPNESQTDASYRELFEETGISKNDIKLHYVQSAIEEFANGDSWQLYLTTGVLKHNVKLIPEKNELTWIPVLDTETLLYKTFGHGSCYVFLRRAIDMLLANDIDFNHLIN